MERERGRDGTVRTYVQVTEGVIYAMKREDETEEEAREETRVAVDKDVKKDPAAREEARSPRPRQSEPPSRRPHNESDKDMVVYPRMVFREHQAVLPRALLHRNHIAPNVQCYPGRIRSVKCE